MRPPLLLALLPLAACSQPAPPAGAPMDGHPGGTTLSAGGHVTAVVKEGGELSVTIGSTARTLDTGVDRRVAIAHDEAFLIYAKLGFMEETDLWRVDLPDGAPTRLTDWRGSEDRPAISPDGTRLAFISGKTGVASWYVTDLLDDGMVVPPERATQLTNTALGPLRPGFPRTGFTPPPTGTDYGWSSIGLTWGAKGVTYSVAP